MEEKNRATSEAEPKAERKPPTDDRWAAVDSLSCTLSAQLVAPHLTIGDLLDLEVGSVINSEHSKTNPVPVWVNDVRLGWAEFDVVGKHLAVRITEI